MGWLGLVLTCTVAAAEPRLEEGPPPVAEPEDAPEDLALGDASAPSFVRLAPWTPTVHAGVGVVEASGPLGAGPVAVVGVGAALPARLRLLAVASASRHGGRGTAEGPPERTWRAVQGRIGAGATVGWRALADAGRPSLDLAVGGEVVVGPTRTQVDGAAAVAASGVAPGLQLGLGVAAPAGPGDVIVHAIVGRSATRNALAGRAPLTTVGATVGWRLARREDG